MKRELEEIINTLNVYEKQELVISLLTEIQLNHNIMLSNLKNIDGYIFGMIHNAENNNLNQLTLKQLDSIKNILNQSPIQGERMNKKHLVKVLLNSYVSREWKEVLLKPYRWNTRR